MKSHKILLLATMLAGSLSLAGCGGGGGSNGDMEPEMTDAQTCAAKGEGYALDGDGECNQDAYNEGKEKGAEEEGMKRDKAADDQQMSDDMKAAQKAAETLLDVLDQAITDLANTTTTDSTTKPSDFASKDGMARETVSVMGDAFKTAHPTIDFGVADAMGYIGGSAFSTSGLKTHKSTELPSTGANFGKFTTMGTYHGVAGKYTCVATGIDSCTSNVNGDGNLVLAGGTWTFAATNPDQMVTDAETIEWGWWASKDSSGKIDMARVFYGHTDSSAAALSGIGDIGGTASYEGKAVGKYAIHRGPNAENDSGHFTADASLSANFTDSEISGMINNFVGADDKSRDWTVKLVSQTIGANGVFEDTTGDDVPDNTGMTVWTMDGSAGKAGGEWVGQLYDQSATGVTPSTTAGAFSAEHGNIGNMIGAFGAEKE